MFFRKNSSHSYFSLYSYIYRFCFVLLRPSNKANYIYNKMTQLRVKEICKAQGITQKELAERIGITPVGLAKAIAGNTTIGTLENIANALNVSLFELLEVPRNNEALCPHCGKPIQLNKA